MKNKTICLEGTINKSCLNIGIHNSNAAIWTYEKKEITLEKIETRCREIIAFMNSNNRKEKQSPHALQKLKEMGNGLCNSLLPYKIKEKIRKTDADFLIIALDNNLVQIPWELICIDDAFLCERFFMGRTVKTQQDIPEFKIRESDNMTKMLVIPNPGGDLKIAEKEGLNICEYIDRANQERQSGGNSIELVLNADIKRQEIKEQLHTYDIVHFAGHGHYDSINAGQCGWKLASENLTADDIEEMAGGESMPNLVFSNACQSARTERWDINAKGNSFGLANAFMISGVNHYLGTFWEIIDEPGSIFAQEFYANLISGTTIGEAVKSARQKLILESPFDLSWASYILYGCPEERYFPQTTHKTHFQRKITQTPLHTINMTRGVRPPIGWDVTKIKETRNWLLCIMIFIAMFCTFSIVNNSMDYLKMIQNNRMKEMLIKKSMEKQKRTDELFKELASISGGIKQAIKNDRKINIELIIDSKFRNEDKEDMLLAIVQNSLCDNSNYSILESRSQSLDKVLASLINKIRLKKIKTIEFRMPEVLVFITALDLEFSSPILFRITDVEKGTIIGKNIFEELNNNNSISSQKKVLTKKLLNTLKKYTP